MIDYLERACEALERACEAIDASFFSGDAFTYKENLEPIKNYVGRWSREIERIEKSIAERKKGSCVCPHEKVIKNENRSGVLDEYICIVCGNTYPF